MKATIPKSRLRFSSLAVPALLIVAGCQDGGVSGGGNNNPISVADDSYGVTQGGILATNAFTGLLSNDSDANGNPLSVALEPGGGATHGILNLNADGSFTYTHDGSATTSDSFRYRATDGAFQSALATVTISVNQNPVASATCGPTPLDTNLNGDLSTSVSDPDGPSLTFSPSVDPDGVPLQGAVSINPDGTFTYMPNTGFRGIDSFRYIVSDGAGGQASNEVTVIVDTARIMPLGDSTTTGATDGGPPILPAVDQRVGYRQPLDAALAGLGYSVDFVGGETYGNGYMPAFDSDNEGHGGCRAEDLALGSDVTGHACTNGNGGVLAWLDAANLAGTPPDIILLHTGTNGKGTSPVGITSLQDAVDVGTLLDKIDEWETTNNRRITVLLAKIIDRNPQNPAVSAFNIQLTTIANGRISSGDRLVLVDQFGALDYAVDINDGVHPNSSGYAKIAAKWQEHLENLLCY